MRQIYKLQVREGINIWRPVFVIPFELSRRINPRSMMRNTVKSACVFASGSPQG